MELNTVQLSGSESNIEQLILKAQGNKIQFFNGCIIWLTDDNGVFWGTDLYGLDWACNVSDNCVKYWDESRDETGALIK